MRLKAASSSVQATARHTPSDTNTINATAINSIQPFVVQLASRLSTDVGEAKTLEPASQLLYDEQLRSDATLVAGKLLTPRTGGQPLPPGSPSLNRTRSISYGGNSLPFKSQAQRRKFAQLLVDGKISNQTFEEWNRETGGKKLPERVGSKSNGSRKTKGRKRAKTRK